MMEILPKNPCFPTFLESLFDDGRVLVSRIGPISDAELRDSAEVLARFERDWRDGMPGNAPRYHPEAALWAAVLVYRAAQFSVFREVEAKEIERELSVRCPVSMETGTQYSADLTFRFLPELTKLARSAAAEDPLVRALECLGAEWPLSSVGMTGIEVEPKAIDVTVAAPSLLRLYVDRILQKGDFDRLRDPRVLAELEVSAGAFRELLSGLPPDIMELLKTRETA